VIRPISLFLLVLSVSAGADDSLSVAVASNFRNTTEEIADAFTLETGVPIRLSSGSTGKLYAQIVNGAPYDLFLAADLERPRLLADNGTGIEDSLQAYVDGKLVLMSADPDIKDRNCLQALRDGSFRKLAIANPATAPYGAAAKAWLQAMGFWDDVESRIVMGENISQTFQFVATRNATLGIVSASQLAAGGGMVKSSCQQAIDAPKDHAVHQGGIILRRTQMHDEARLFMKFLRSDTARALMRAHGYGLPRL
jgi:molybdate transport system substrate-binding protein